MPAENGYDHYLFLPPRRFGVESEDALKVACAAELHPYIFPHPRRFAMHGR